MKIGTGEKLVSVVHTVFMCPGLEILVFGFFVLFSFLVFDCTLGHEGSSVPDHRSSPCLLHRNSES